MDSPLPLPVERTLKRLGVNISFARRRRRWSQAMLAVRIGASVATVRRMEEGYPGIALQHLARVLHVFGDLAKLDALLDTANDSVGLALADEALPRRVRAPKRTADSGAL
ncbi:MAG TPA: helix-turn-helix transcriptional regulator [Casimicrobiaceae bacterium]